MPISISVLKPPVSAPRQRHFPALFFAVGVLAMGVSAFASTGPAVANETQATSVSPLPQQDAELREALARYRELSGNPAWQQSLPPPPDGKLTTGQPYAGIALLTRRLLLLGDLPAGTTPPARYEGQLVEGVKAFQARHGLTTDGVIGKGTLEQLNVAPETRVRQLELAIERLRSTQG